MRRLLLLISFLVCIAAKAQITNGYNFANYGQRVCLADATVTLSPASVRINFLDAAVNTTQTTSVYRRHLYGTGTDWVLMVSGLAAGTTSWTDNTVAAGDVWEYQIKRVHSGVSSTGYVAATVGYDQTNYRGRMILLVADNIVSGLPARYNELKKDLTGDGWFVQELVVARAADWDAGNRVVTIRSQIQSIYNAAPANDKPKQLFILGHVPLPRSGLNGQTPDDHIQNAGARGADTYYADIDGVFTDAGTYNPGGLSSPYAVNLPGDFKWDQDNIPSELEMAFGRINFTDITSYSNTELAFTDQYLTRLHHYKQADAGFNMGNRTAFFSGYDNSNDGSYRSLPAISGGANVLKDDGSLPHPQWVQQNGPFAMYMQNVQAPQTGEWDTYGMNAAIYSSDQSYWGFGDVPEGNQYSKIRSILCANTKCVMVIWTTMAINLFHQMGAGESAGMACKQIMDHNTTNQKLEKPSSPYDTPAFWNRTQFVIYGDPTIRLQQVVPATLPQIILGPLNSIVLQWTASTDNNIAGYAVYKSTTEFGKFNKISGASFISATTFTDTDPHGGEWYMIRAVKQQITGSGIFFNPSQGIFIKNTITITPVTLSNFTAVKQKEMSLLQWSTATEQNSAGFNIQRSSDGSNWIKIGFENTKALNGNSNTLLQYSFTDTNPLSGNDFYRLQIMNTDGSFKYSEVKILVFDKQQFLIVQPNPVKDLLHLNYNSSDKIISVELFDVNGKRFFKTNTAVDHISTAVLPAGMYLLKVVTQTGKRYEERIIKQ